MTPDIDSPEWYLLKNDDGSLFGPITFDQLQRWVAEAQVSPLDKVSVDQETWFKAPMIPDLAMDFLIELSPDQYYGPTSLGAVQEFLRMGEVHGGTQVTNCRDGSTCALRDMPGIELLGVDTETGRPGRSSIRLNLQQRIRELEEALLDERRMREQAEHVIAKLESRLASYEGTGTL